MFAQPHHSIPIHDDPSQMSARRKEELQAVIEAKLAEINSKDRLNEQLQVELQIVSECVAVKEEECQQLQVRMSTGTITVLSVLYYYDYNYNTQREHHSKESELQAEINGLKEEIRWLHRNPNNVSKSPLRRFE